MNNLQPEESKQMRANLLHMYKQEMIGNKEKKNIEKQQRIIEERKYLENANLEFEKERQKKQNQKAVLMNQRMEEYKNYMNNKMTTKLKNRLPSVNQNNMGKENDPKNYINETNNRDLNSNQQSYQNNIQQSNYTLDNNPYDQNRYNENVDPGSYYKDDTPKHSDYPSLNNNNIYEKSYNTIDVMGNQPNLYNYSSNGTNNLNLAQNASNNINNNINNINNNISSQNTNPPNSSSMNNNHNQNNYYNPQLSDFEIAARSKKYEQQLQYKNFLDSQVSTNRQNRSQSSARVYENKYVPQKRNNELSINPFTSKNYDIGISSLNINPITNPMNNFGYNKYITPGTNQAGMGYKMPTSDKLQRAANSIIG